MQSIWDNELNSAHEYCTSHDESWNKYILLNNYHWCNRYIQVKSSYDFLVIVKVLCTFLLLFTLMPVSEIQPRSGKLRQALTKKWRQPFQWAVRIINRTIFNVLKKTQCVDVENDLCNFVIYRTNRQTRNNRKRPRNFPNVRRRLFKRKSS